MRTPPIHPDPAAAILDAVRDHYQRRALPVPDLRSVRFLKIREIEGILFHVIDYMEGPAMNMFWLAYAQQAPDGKWGGGLSCGGGWHPSVPIPDTPYARTCGGTEVRGGRIEDPDRLVSVARLLSNRLVVAEDIIDNEAVLFTIPADIRHQPLTSVDLFDKSGTRLQSCPL